MPAFFSPVTNPASWTYSVADLTVPAGLRYAGYRLRGVRAVPGSGSSESIAMPAYGALRRVDDAGTAVVQVDVVPFSLRSLMAELPWGAPTFYLAIESPGTTWPFVDHDVLLGGTALHPAATVTIALAVQDRHVVDPATWARQIAEAVTRVSGDVAPWAPFRAALEAQLPVPVLLLDHAGRPRETGDVDLVYGPQTHRVTLAPADRGDLQAAVRRTNAGTSPLPFTDLFGPAAQFTLRPVPAAGGEVQLAALEDGTRAADEIVVTRQRRHISYTDLTAWFAAQTATTAPAASRMQRYTRGNTVRHIVNGLEFYNDLFRELHGARGTGDGLLLTGWSMVHDAELAGRLPSDPPDMSTSLLAAADALTGGKFSLLPAQHYQIEEGGALQWEIALLIVVLMAVVLVLEAEQVSGLRSDGTGVFVAMMLFAFSPVALSVGFDTGGAPLEPNKGLVDDMAGKPGVTARLSRHPASRDDNPAAASGGVIEQVYSAATHFGVHHHKLAVVKAGTRHVGYCGGIDLNTDRLDDARHLAPMPYHDVHARIEGPAVTDLTRTFADRWARDVPGVDPAFAVPPLAAGTGSDIVQVARTYHRSTAPERTLSFAPRGDRTIHDSLVAGLASAREYVYIEDQYFTPSTEYRAALLAAAARVKSLVIVLPANPDQPFGEVVRTALIEELRAAGPHVHIGYPRLRFRLAENDLRAATGRCLVRQKIEAGHSDVHLGPSARVPEPPFWVSVDGELMYAHQRTVSPPEQADSVRLDVLRGPDTRLYAARPAPSGPEPRAHELGAAATLVNLPDVYVHAKMQLVDDVFLGVGSANVNRRGHFHDGEANVFTMPEALRTSPANPLAALRMRLWGEMLDLPKGMRGLLRDPVAASALFARSPLFGNRLVQHDARPTKLMLGMSTGDGVVGLLLNALGFTAGAVGQTDIFNSVVDPTSAVESGP